MIKNKRCLSKIMQNKCKSFDFLRNYWLFMYKKIEKVQILVFIYISYDIRYEFINCIYIYIGLANIVILF